MSAARGRLLGKRGIIQTVYDFVGAPLRMTVLPDAWSNRLGMSSLEDERLRAVLPELRGRVLDIGSGRNRLIRLYGNGVGVDVYDWGGGTMVVEDTRNLPFEDESFDTVSFVASLNHIPYRQEALLEAKRLLRIGGRLIMTMIGPALGMIGHKIWWYGEHRHRRIADGELPGMSPKLVTSLLGGSGYVDVIHRRFFYHLNHLFIATKP